jgi:Secretion system C-terminal sorting domain
MKKVYNSIFMLTLTVIGYSQPILQAADVNATVGESFNYNSTDWISEGPGGAGVTWDLSGMTTTGTGTLDMNAPSPLFPLTNITRYDAAGGSYFEDHNATGQYAHGIEGTGVIITFQDIMQLMAFPLSDATYASDTHAATFTSGGFPFTRVGTTVIEGDGYGTLITPDGTFTDVVRVRLDQVYTDTYSMGTFNTVVEVYQWYKAGIHHPLASVSTLNSGATIIEYGTYLSAGLGLNENNLNDFTVYPNPATDQLFIDLDANLQNSTVIVSNAVGQQLKSYNLSEFTNEVSINIEDLTSGVYFISVSSNGQISEPKRFVKL